MDPYETGKATGRSPSIKTEVSGQIVVVLDTYRDNRELAMIYPYSRCVRMDEVHELIMTNERNAKPGTEVNQVSGIGFMAFQQSGVIMVGDMVRSARLGPLGRVVGFDVSHYPNHFNIVIYSEERRSGRKCGLELGDEILIDGQFVWDSLVP